MRWGVAALDHVAATPETTVRRAVWLEATFDLAGRHLLCVGDHDLTSLAACRLVPELTATVLVFREGIRSAALRDAVVEHLGGSAEARLLMVRRGKRLRRSAVVGAPQATGSRDVATADAR